MHQRVMTVELVKTEADAPLTAKGVPASVTGWHDPAAILAFFALSGAILWRVWGAHLTGSSWLMALSAFGGFVAADFFSGLVHWGFDTWGKPTTPVLGPKWIVPFRIHHVDPKAMTLHGFAETNGANCIAALPLLGFSLLLPPNHLWSASLLVFLVALCLGTFGTNQFHKWAHLDHVHPLIRLSQSAGLILSPEHHAAHHAAPYDRNYCITTGWLNPLLTRINFFRRSERLITAVTGALPRNDDLSGRPVGQPAPHT
jgi:ubiquitin-conjugating enzyme E2 variant